MRRGVMGLACVAAAGAALPACSTKHTLEVKPIEVRPIELTINLRLDRELDEFFDFEEPAPEATPAQTPGAAPAPQASPNTPDGAQQP